MMKQLELTRGVNALLNMFVSRRLGITVGIVAIAAFLLSPAVVSAQEACVVTELRWCETDLAECDTNADCTGGQNCVDSGTALLPPRACIYIGWPDPGMRYHTLKALGVPVAVLNAQHFGFVEVQVAWDPPGFAATEVFDSSVVFGIQGVGDLEGYARRIEIPDVDCTVYTGERTLHAESQTFENDMLYLFGELPSDDDFTRFQFSAGSDLGLPSPGETTLTKLPDGTFQVDSFFDITYQIDFEGAPGGPFEDMSEVFTDTVRMYAVGRVIPTVSEWGLVAMALVVFVAAAIVFRRVRMARA
jgi:hypothetical protein